MRVKQAFRFELAPNRTQRASLAKHVGAARFAYSWGLALCLTAVEGLGLDKDPGPAVSIQQTVIGPLAPKGKLHPDLGRVIGCPAKDAEDGVNKNVPGQGLTFLEVSREGSGPRP